MYLLIYREQREKSRRGRGLGILSVSWVQSITAYVLTYAQIEFGGKILTRIDACESKVVEARYVRENSQSTMQTEQSISQSSRKFWSKKRLLFVFCLKSKWLDLYPLHCLVTRHGLLWQGCDLLLFWREGRHWGSYYLEDNCQHFPPQVWATSPSLKGIWVLHSLLFHILTFVQLKSTSPYTVMKHLLLWTCFPERKLRKVSLGWRTRVPTP